jgi:uncharacterized protein (UPF0276 family)
MERVLGLTLVQGIILERDENIPPFKELAIELAKARELGRKYQQWH